MRALYESYDTLAVADENIESWYERNKEMPVVYISTDLQFLRLRVGRAEGEISELILSLNEKEWIVDAAGRLENYPKELDNIVPLLMRIK